MTDEKRTKRREYLRKWYQENKVKILAKQKEWIKNNKDKRSATQKRYADTHKEQIKERLKRWEKQNPDKVIKKKNTYKQKNPDKVREWRTSWAKNNRDKENARHRRWSKHNPDKVREVLHIRRARKANTLVTLTRQQEREILATGCFFADDDCSGPLSIAHDMPISKGGQTTRGNLFCLCRRHNARMQAKTLAETIKQTSLPI